MKGLADELGEKPVLIPSSDRYVTAIANHRELLEEYYLLNPGIQLQADLALKQTQYRLALDNGMPMSVTHMVSTQEDVIEFSNEADYPCLVKPWHFREWEQ
ncbi:MAG: hypothetical protein KAV87_17210, partial [Desulfobacteraceae bacterium]|nr:hypothetical protein [Desulfobacteraceae bacterium]